MEVYVTCLRGFGVMLGLLAALPAWAAEPSWEMLGESMGADDVAAVLGEDGQGLWFLGGEVRRQLGRPVQGMDLEVVASNGERRYVDTGAALLGGDLSSRGELALVTVEGTVLVGTDEQLRPLDLGDLFVTQARWDPQGTRLAVTAWSGGARPWGAHYAATVDELVRAIDSEVYLVDLEGHSQQLTHGPKQDYNPVWSPDGQQLLFVSLRTGYASLFLVDVIQGTEFQVTNLGSERGAPAIPVPLSDRCWWTHDQILFETAAAVGANEVWRMTLGGHATRVTSGSALGVAGGVWILRTPEGLDLRELRPAAEGRRP